MNFETVHKNRLKSIKTDVVQVVPHITIVDPCRQKHCRDFVLTVDDFVDEFENLAPSLFKCSNSTCNYSAITESKTI